MDIQHIQFNPALPNPYFHSPEKFRELSAAYWRSMTSHIEVEIDNARNDLFNTVSQVRRNHPDLFQPGVFAPSPAFRSPGVVGQGIPTIISVHPRKCICRKCNPAHLSGVVGQGVLS